MCNKVCFKIKSVASCSPKYGFLPCGKCFDCRTSLKNGWIFRLRVELEQLVHKGWKIGFFTLTYSDRNLPKMPCFLIKSKPFEADVPCFEKNDVRYFIKMLKKWLHDTYDCYRGNDGFGNIQDLAPRYMICAEYGEHTQRPHYHGIICVPPRVDMHCLHRKIKMLWYHKDKPDIPNLEPTEKGFVFPFDFNGGFDSHGYEHKPFVCDSVKAAACYAAKYVCKDIAYLDFIKDVELRKKVRVYRQDIALVPDFQVDLDVFGDILDCYELPIRREVSVRVGEEPLMEFKLSDYLPFHFQSKSLGISFLDSLSDAERLDKLLEGHQFVGEDTLQGLPVYLKNKIVFDPDYTYDAKTGKRLVRRKAKPFFRQNFASIFDAKVSAFAEKVKQMQSMDFWMSQDSSVVTYDDLKLCERMLSFRTTDARKLAEDYLAFFGVPYCECYNINRSLAWYRRYDENYVDITNCPRISVQYYSWLHSCFDWFMRLYALVSAASAFKKQANDREVNRINDFWKSQT